jgi:hypothetical protein
LEHQLKALRTEAKADIEKLHHRIFSLEYKMAVFESTGIMMASKPKKDESSPSLRTSSRPALTREASTPSLGIVPQAENHVEQQQDVEVAPQETAPQEVQLEVQDDADGQSEVLDHIPPLKELDRLGHHFIEVYELNSSCWDVSVFAFSEVYSWRTSVSAIIMYLSNLFLQVIFVYIAYKELMSQAVTKESVEQAWAWRVTTAHDMKFMDPITEQSLARKICEDNAAPSMSSTASALHGKVTSYLNGSSGLLLCLMSLLVWWLTCSVEVQDCVKMATAFYRIPVSSRTEVVQTGVGLRLQSMSWNRRLWSLQACLARFGVAIALLWAGSYYLSSRIDIETLLLNAVALELVLNLDELIFAAVAPLRATKLLPQILPLPVYTFRQRYRFGFDLPGRATMIFLVGLFSFWFVWLLTGIRRHVYDVQEALCGRNLDFVYALDPGGAIVLHPTAAHPPGIQEFYRYRAVMQSINDPAWVGFNMDHSPDSLSDTSAGLSWSPLSLGTRPRIPIGQRMKELNPFCLDSSPDNAAMMVWPTNFTQLLVSDTLKRMADMRRNLALQGKQFQSCIDGVDYCNADNEMGVRMRQWCPVTCGCDLPTSSLVASGLNSGCPPSCTKNWTVSLSLETCDNKNVSSPLFQAYLNGLKQLRQSYQDNVDWAARFDIWISKLSRKGCAGYDLGAFGSLCGENVFMLKPLSLICPQTCGCNRSQNVKGHYFEDLCPTTCHAT